MVYDVHNQPSSPSPFLPMMIYKTCGADNTSGTERRILHTLIYAYLLMVVNFRF